MLNFTVGPVMSSEETCRIGAEQVPYFRTSEFSELMFENEVLIKKFAKAEEDARVVFITGSGTASMEATVINTLSPKDKALACPPGISFIVLSAEAQKRVADSKTKCMYFDLKDALKNGERGQTPFTPAVGILRQINARLHEIDKNGGVDTEIKRVRMLANDFREKIKELPFEFVSESMSNAVTALHPTTASAYDIFLTLKD